VCVIINVCINVIIININSIDVIIDIINDQCCEVLCIIDIIVYESIYYYCYYDDIVLLLLYYYYY